MDLKFSAHLDTLLAELPVSERIAKFSELGFPAFELWCWWDYDVRELSNSSQENNIPIAAVCTKFVSLTDEGSRDEYLKGVKETIETCNQLGCNIIISQVGDELENVSREQQKDSVISGLKESAKLLEGTGITLVIEPLNLLVDHAGYFLSRSDEAAEIVESVGSPSVKMLFDVYHQQITEGNLIPNIRKYISLIGHFHIADHPGRAWPGTGEINYRNVLSAIADTGYDGYVGLEFLFRAITVPGGSDRKDLESREIPLKRQIEILQEFVETYGI